MRIDIVTLFPEMVAPTLDHSIVKRARERGLITINVVNLRDFTTDRHRSADDIPYGGGGGMVMKVEPIARAIAALTRAEAMAEQNLSGGKEQTALASVFTENDTRDNETNDRGVPSSGWDAVNLSPGIVPLGVEALESKSSGIESSSIESSGIMKGPRIALTDPRGPRFTQETARRWAREPHLILLCGHYEGVDERVRQHLVTDEVSIGDYILTGGELPALIIVDALTRLQPGALGDEQAPDKDTFADDLLEYPHYTRPYAYNEWRTPDILLCGHHAQIERWRRWHRLHATRERRPDLFARLTLTREDRELLAADEPTAPADPKAAAREARASRKAAAGVPSGGQCDEMQRRLIVADTVQNKEKHEGTDGSGTGNDT